MVNTVTINIRLVSVFVSRSQVDMVLKTKEKYQDHNFFAR